MVILGAGESGVGAAMLGIKEKFEVFVSDSGIIKEKYKRVLLHHEIDFEESMHNEQKILTADEVIKSPGIPENTNIVQKIRAKGIPVISEIEFAGRFTKAKRICITGSNGKTTTTLLLYHILKKAGLNAGLGGNVGKSFAAQVAENDFDFYVLEISSFQLDGMYDFKADIAVLLNITPDHLDRYGYDFQKYVASKFRITQNQTKDDSFIYCFDDPVIRKELLLRETKAEKYPFSIVEVIGGSGAWSDEKKLTINVKPNICEMTLEKLALQGKHNIYNSMAAGIAARVLDIRKDIIKESFSDFQNVPHRLEFIARIHGVDFVNDSKATNVNSTWYALENAQNPVIWIAGGIDKGNETVWKP
jgi:UDP-N-acetylmuramoylalanine--D-glutamate ligase